MKTTGEVSAIVGYNKQYEVFAIEIYESLLNNKFEWVEFASNEVGKLDDVYIGCIDEIKAYQVKDVKTNFTFSKFVNSETESVFQGCFQGWKNLVVKYPDKKIDAKYISNEIPSKSDKIESFNGISKPSFIDFKYNFWDVIRKNNAIPKGWETVFDTLKEIVKSQDEDLINFIKSFEFLLSDEYDIADKTTNNNFQRIKDIQKISKHIFKIVGTRGTTRFDKNQFLVEFDFLKRYETHFRHSFFVDEEHYQPINETINELEAVIKKLDNGYIALIGNAGSGKSTLLTKWIKGRKEKVLKYYAYVNKEMNNEFGYRGEADIFLKDLLIQMRENQFSIQENLPSDDISELQKQLFEELQKLSYRDEKVYIIVDGLDHIDREQNVSRSLIDILPLPEQIPKNIYFVLGSRTVNNLEFLPERVKLNLEKENRTISITPLSISQIQNLLLSYKIKLSQNQLDLIHKNTLGHPLFLRYTIEELLSSNSSLYDDIILQKSFNGDIYDEYRIFWNKNKEEDNFIEILGIISRFRYSYVDISLLPLFIKNKREDWYKVEKLAEHFFFKKDNIWQFFHNSFKEFLKEETAKNFITKEYENEINFSFHLKIYEIIKDINSDYKWNALYHLFNAGKYDEVTKLATQEYFRNQWFCFRNYKFISEDIKIASKSSYRTSEPKKLFEYYLSGIELNQRVDNFHLSNYYKTFHQLNKISIANSFIFDNTELLVSNDKAIEYAIEIYKRGDKNLPLELLKKSEPIYLLNVSKEVSLNRYYSDEKVEIDEANLIFNWAKLSSLYYPIDNIIGKLSGLKVSQDKHRPSRKVNLLGESIYAIQNLLIELENWEKLNELYSCISKIKGLNLFYFHFDVVWNLDDKNQLYNICLNELKKTKKINNNPINRRLALVEVFINKNIQQGNIFFKTLKSPLEPESRMHNLDNFLGYIFDYSRLFYITTNSFTIDTKTFSPSSNKQIITSFYNEFAELGKSFAYIYLGNVDASKGFIFRFKQILNYFHHHISDPNYEYEINENKATLIKLILNVSEKISNDFFNKVLDEISLEWESNKKYWRNSHKQEIIDEIQDIGTNDLWCQSELIKLDDFVLNFGDNYSRIEEGIKQIELWANLNETERGNEILGKLMDISFDISGEKDNQLDYLIDWLDEKDLISSKEIEFYLKCLESLSNKLSQNPTYISQKVLELSLNRGNAYEIYKYLLFKGYLNFNDSLEVLLKYFLNVFPERYKLITKMFARINLSFENEYSNREIYLNELFKMNLSNNDLHFLINEIEINSVYEQRFSYLEVVKDYITKKRISFEFENSSKKKKDHHSSNFDNDELRLKNNQKLTKKEVFDRINSYTDIVELLENEDGINRYFEWSKAIIKIIDKLSYDEIRQLLKLRNLRSNELVKIAKGILEHNGDKKFSKEILNQAYKNSSPSGWYKYYDGGSRIETFKLLKEIDNSKETSELIFKDFIEDIILSDRSLSSSIDKIFKLIDNEFDNNSYYVFIENYKNQLLKTHFEDIDCPSVDGNINNDAFFLSFFLFLVEFPTDIDEILIEILLEEYTKEKTFINILLKSLFENQYEFTYLKMLSAISLIETDFVKQHQENVINLLNHSNFQLHSLSVKLLEKLGLDYKSLFISKTSQLPFSYKIEYDYKPELLISEKEKMDRINRKGYLRDTNDPIEYCNLYRTEIKLLSEETGFAIVNIASRIMMLGDKNWNKNTWYSNLPESEIRDIYENKFELKISYKRPRYQKVWIGLMIVLKELWELKIIDRGLANYLSKAFDENCYFIKVEKRPKFIKSIIKKDDYVPYADEKWVSELSNEYLDEALKYKLDNDSFILAEHSIIEGQGDGYTKEIRQSFIEFEEFDIAKGELIFEPIDNYRISDYVEAEGDNLCLYNWKLTINDKVNWIAFNPQYAVKLGLSLSIKGNFRWLDNEGNIVIESIYWKNNNIYNKSRHLHSECGYGWYVIISKNGLEKLKKLFGLEELFHHKKVFRNLVFIQNRYNTYIDKSNNLSNVVKVEF